MYYRQPGFTLTGRGLPRRVVTLRVTANYFDVYRIQPIVGRAFLSEEQTAVDGHLGRRPGHFGRADHAG
jgi:hypothetical protein